MNRNLLRTVSGFRNPVPKLPSAYCLPTSSQPAECSLCCRMICVLLFVITVCCITLTIISNIAGVVKGFSGCFGIRIFGNTSQLSNRNYFYISDNQSVVNPNNVSAFRVVIFSTTTISLAIIASTFI